MISPVPPSVKNIRVHHIQHAINESTDVFAFEASPDDLEKIRLSQSFYEVRSQNDEQLAVAKSELKAAEAAGFSPFKPARAFIFGPEDQPNVFFLFLGDDGRSARFVRWGY